MVSLNPIKSLPNSPDTFSVSRFLATASAERLERALDAKYLRRENGFYWLDVGREWRIGAAAMRILALSESNGSRFREWSEHPAVTRTASPVHRQTGSSPGDRGD